MIERILDLKNIKVHLNSHYFKGLEFKYAHPFLFIPIYVFYQFKNGLIP